MKIYYGNHYWWIIDRANKLFETCATTGSGRPKSIKYEMIINE